MQSQQLTEESNSAVLGMKKSKVRPTCKKQEKSTKESTEKKELNGNTGTFRKQERFTKEGGYKCRACGFQHGRKCPAYGETCRICEKCNHFAKMCRYRNLNTVEEERESNSNTDLFIGIIESNLMQVNSVREWYQKIDIRGKEIECKVDIGAEVNILNEQTAKNDVCPVVEAPRKILISIQDAVKKELDRVENLNIIKKVIEPTEWCSSLVTVKKTDGTLRLCLDPQNLNQAVLREWFQLPTFEEIAARMGNASVFSILDGNKGGKTVMLRNIS